MEIPVKRWFDVGSFADDLINVVIPVKMVMVQALLVCYSH